MMAPIRRKLATGVRVRNFFLANPSDEPGHKQLFESLQERLQRSDVLSKQQTVGADKERAAVTLRSQLRRRINKVLLPHLVRVGQALGKEHPDLAGRFRIPKLNMPLRVFSDMTGSMLDLAKANRELFVAKGLSQAFLDDLTETFAEFEKATATSHEGRREHVGATADLAQVTVEIMELVRQLDALNRYRFALDRELLAAWKSARNVVVIDGGGGTVPPAEGKAPPASGASAA
jgi:hypothetical protein